MTYGGTQYLACIISPSVASLVTVNVIDSVNKICGQLPFQILPDELDCATLSYKVVLPQDSMYSTLRILVSWPTMLDSRQGNHITGPTASDVELLDPDSLILVERVSTSIRTYLESTLQLISMGLSDHPRSRGQRQDDIRDLEQRLHQARIDVKNRTHRIEYLKAAMKEAEILDRRRSSVETFYESIGRHDSVQSRDLNAGNKGLSKAVVREELSTERSLLEMSARRIQEFEKKLKSLRCSDPWISDYTVKDKELVSMPPLCPPITYYTATGRDILSSAPTTCSFDRLRGTHAGLHCVSTRHAPTTNTSMPCVASSDNVPLSLDSDVEHLGELCLYFRPSLLEARFERWVQTYEPEQRDHIDDEFDEHLADAEDLLLLEAESDYLHSTRLDVDDYESLCRKHRLSLPDTVRQGGDAEGWCTTKSSDRTRVASPERQTHGHGSAGDGVSFDLLNAYLTMSEDAYANTMETRRESAMRLSRILAWSIGNADAVLIPGALPTMEPDFIVQEPSPPIALDSRVYDTPLQGNIKEIWPKLDLQHKKDLMASLVRVVAAIWHKFDLLGGNSLDEFLDNSGADSPSDPDPVLLQEDKQIHERTRPFPFMPMPTATEAVVTLDGHSKPKVLGSADRLCKLEDEFMSRSFLDAFKEATMPSQHHSSKGTECETAASCGGDHIGTRETDSTTHGNDWIDADSSLPSIYETSRSQWMTTTKARVQESVAAQDKAHITPMLRFEEQKGSWMRQFDFSLDDLLVQVGPIANLSNGDENVVHIVGVSRWKTFCPVKAGVEQCSEWAPRSANKFQLEARSSSYPLVHLLSLPDVICASEFGGDDDSRTGLDREKAPMHRMRGLACDYVRQLGQVCQDAAKILRLPVKDKERTLYHRWMAGWHERCPHAPKKTKARFDMIRAARQYKAEECGRGGPGRAIAMERQGKARDVHSLGSASEEASPRIRGQQPGDNAEPVRGGMAVKCRRCAEEWSEGEQVLRDLACFDETERFLDEVMSSESRREVQEEEEEEEEEEEAEEDRVMMMMGLSGEQVQMARGWKTARVVRQEGARMAASRLSEAERCIVRAEIGGGGGGGGLGGEIVRMPNKIGPTAR
ncbi:hypothetical protein BGX31_001214 [Mortierella sp. GBA43]|nr:hypothetical protein BGX31_001214 [Mortierella sp. GBA43]